MVLRPDLMPSESQGNHLTGDVRPLLKVRWDLIIAFPPCTYLCSSGMHWTVRGLRDPQLTEDALDLVRTLMEADCPALRWKIPLVAFPAGSASLTRRSTLGNSVTQNLKPPAYG